MVWPFRPKEEEDEESVYTEEEYEEEYEYEVEVTDDEYESDAEDEEEDEEEDDGVLVEAPEDEDDDADDDDDDADDEEGVEEEEEYETEDDDEHDDEHEHERDLQHTVHDEQSQHAAETTDDDDDDDAPTSVEEKKGLLALAAEHDRVDIIQSILTDDIPPEERQELLHGGLPPLHLAVSFGSTNATSCLLRMGANPSIRPTGLEDNLKKYNDLTAWELAFGTSNEGDSPSKASWFGGGGSSGNGNKIADIAPSKREGIRHAFTAEALRCIGADEKERLQQLLGSGMPKETDIGGKNIRGWCQEMGATACLEIIAPPVVVVVEQPQVPMSPRPDKVQAQLPPTEPPSPTLIRRLSSDYNDADSLRTRLEEQDELAKGLSTYLDNLAEEVSVCHGLLLMGNGASALAAHVRSLNDQQDFLERDLQERNCLWQGTEQELQQWKERCSADDDLIMPQFQLLRKQSFSNDPMQLRAQLAASENKIRKLRASIEDMAEESESAMKEVEKRGLTGGIKLVRKLREEIRALEFQVSEAKSGDAMCKAMLQRLQQQWKDQKAKEALAHETRTPPEQAVDRARNGNGSTYVTPVKKKALNTLMEDPPAEIAEDPLAAVAATATPAAIPGRSRAAAPQNGLAASDKLTSGQSEALMKYNIQTNNYMPVDLWKLLLRIIGLGRVAVSQNVADLKKQATATTVMIV